MTPGQQQRKDAQDKARRQQQADEKVRELEKEIERLRALIGKMDEHAPPADETCHEPGISYSEACRRRLRDEGHSLFQETTDTGGDDHASD
jgi:hypothetical protein